MTCVSNPMIAVRTYPECACGCGLTGELTKKTGHVRRLCKCNECKGRRNQKKGQRGQRAAHRALGGIGNTPSNEEWWRAMSLDVWVEVKAGQQIPVTFTKFIEGAWFRSALGQAQRALPVGVDAKPAVFLVLPNRGGKWIVAKM